jgi:hypothetical protein
VDLKRSPELEEAIGMIWLTGPVQQEALRNGANQVAVQLAEGAEAVRLTGVEVLVRYAKTE